MAVQAALMGAQALQGISKAIDQYERANYAESQARINRLWSDYAAKDAIRRGGVQAREFEKSVRKLRGEQRVRAAAQGIEVDEGISDELQQEAAETGALDVMEIENSAWRQAFGIKEQSRAFRFAKEAEARSHRQEAAQTLLTTSTNVATTAAQAKMFGDQMNMPTIGRVPAKPAESAFVYTGGGGNIA